MTDRINRRRLLKVLGAGGFSGIAGCSQNSNRQDETETELATTAAETPPSSATGSPGQTETATPRDSEGPELSLFKVRPGDARSAIAYEVTASDERGIAEVRIATETEELAERFDGTPEIDIAGTISATPGSTNSVQVTVIDQAGNQVTQTRRSYARVYDRVENLHWNVGCTYRTDGGQWDCKAGKPSVGPYEKASSEATRHLDQLTGHGVRRVLLEFRPERLRTPEDRLIESDLAEDIRLQYKFDIVRSIEKGRLGQDLHELRRRIESVPANHRAKEHGSPVVTLSSVFAFGGKDAQAKELAETIRDRYGGFAGLMDEIRSNLQIGGTDPYLVAQLGMGLSSPENGSNAYLSWLESFDAVTHALWLDGMGPDYQTAIGKIQVIYRHQWRWARDQGLDFIPVVLPGYDNRENDCWETDNVHIARDPKLFKSALSVAAEYATTGRLTVRSFNDWFDGTQVEPGTMNGEKYDTAYLAPIKTLQQTDAVGTDRTVHHVSPNGVDSNIGSTDAPVRTIGHAIYRAEPGDTIEVKPGRYHEVVETVRSGTAEAPITITGPPDAVYIGGNMTDFPEPLKIRHSHIHITGLTFDGLQNPDAPDDASSYTSSNIQIRPGYDGQGKPPVLEDLKVKPHAVGNTQGNCIHVFSSDGVEVGEFRVIGPAGLRYKLTDRAGHWGEIVYLGTPADAWQDLWNGHPDRTRNVHIHHIDNSAGYHHSELVNAKLGTRDILIEYCTDGGGSQNTENYPSAAIRLQSFNATVRWCDLKNGHGDGVEVASYNARDAQQQKPESELIEAERRGGTDNEIYGNRVKDFDDLAFAFDLKESGQTPDAQRIFCGNEYNGPTDGEPGIACSNDVPQGDGVGHLGGDSPWA